MKTGRFVTFGSLVPVAGDALSDLRPPILMLVSGGEVLPFPHAQCDPGQMTVVPKAHFSGFRM